jgi:hypothetical protein
MKTFATHIDENGRLIIPPEVAQNLGLITDIELMNEENEWGLKGQAIRVLCGLAPFEIILCDSKVFGYGRHSKDILMYITASGSDCGQILGCRHIIPSAARKAPLPRRWRRNDNVRDISDHAPRRIVQDWVSLRWFCSKLKAPLIGKFYQLVNACSDSLLQRWVNWIRIIKGRYLASDFHSPRITLLEIHCNDGCHFIPLTQIQESLQFMLYKDSFVWIGLAGAGNERCGVIHVVSQEW